MRKSMIVAALLFTSVTGIVQAAYNSAVDALLAQADEHIGQGDYGRADMVAQRIVRIDPDDGRGWALLATIREAQGEPKAAAEYRARERIANGEANDNLPVIVFGDQQTDIGIDGPPQQAEHSTGTNGPPIDGWEVDPPRAAGDNTRTGTGVVAVDDRLRRLPGTAARSESEIWRQEGRRGGVPNTLPSDNTVLADGGVYTRNGVRAPSHVAHETTTESSDTTGSHVSSRTKPRHTHSVVTSAERRRDYNNYTPRQKSALARINEKHRRHVAKIQRKLFGRHRDDERRVSRYDKVSRHDKVSRGNKADQFDRDGTHRGRRRGSNNHNRSTASLVPPGYYPPRGLCRVWYYDVEPDRQPPADDCDYLRAHLPYGARLLIGT